MKAVIGMFHVCTFHRKASFGGREVSSSLRIQFLSSYDKLTFVTSRPNAFRYFSNLFPGARYFFTSCNLSFSFDRRINVLCLLVTKEREKPSFSSSSSSAPMRRCGIRKSSIALISYFFLSETEHR